jgi:hypothetical protein
VVKDHSIKKDETAAARKINKARDRFPMRNCPRPGISREVMIANAGLIGEVRVFPEVVMFGSSERKR